MRIQTDYHGKIFGERGHSPTQGLQECVDRSLRVLRSRRDEFDSIAFRGYSGAMIAPLVALQLEKAITLVRKPGEVSHSRLVVEGAVDCRYIILDDFVQSGNTVREIQIALLTHHPKSLCVGIATYSPLSSDFWYNDSEAKSYMFVRPPSRPRPETVEQVIPEGYTQTPSYYSFKK